jgi:phospholipid/cholesterol/gamma-HCH transport system substrate-binding protein
VIDSRLRLKAAIGMSIVLVLGLVSFAIGGMRIFERNYSLTVEVEDAAGLESGDPVRVAGVAVGSVTSVERRPQEGTLRVEFQVDSGTELSKASTASVRLRTLLGKKYLHISDPGTGPTLAEGELIPVSQTEPATDVDTLLNAAEPTIERTDIGSINGILASVDRTLAGRGEQLRGVFGDLAELASTFSDRKVELSRLIDSTNRLTTVVGERDPELRSVLDGMDLVLAALSDRGGNLTNLVDQVRTLSDTLSPLIAGNRNEYTRFFEDVNQVSELLVRQKDRLDMALTQLPHLAERFHATTREGSWVNVYIVGLIATPFLMEPVDLGSSDSLEPGIAGGVPRLWVDPPQLLPDTNVAGIDILTEDHRTIRPPEGYVGG